VTVIFDSILGVRCIAAVPAGAGALARESGEPGKAAQEYDGDSNQQDNAALSSEEGEALREPG
jgi:hypothetical protein